MNEKSVITPPVRKLINDRLKHSQKYRVMDSKTSLEEKPSSTEIMRQSTKIKKIGILSSSKRDLNCSSN